MNRLQVLGYIVIVGTSTAVLKVIIDRTIEFLTQKNYDYPGEFELLQNDLTLLREIHLRSPKSDL